VGAFDMLIVLVLIAGIVGAARLRLSAHKPAEIVVGWLVGFFSGAVLYLFP
jgi:membrane-associated phospholipid phosphatase